MTCIRTAGATAVLAILSLSPSAGATDLLIQGGTVVTAEGERKADIRIRGETIDEVGSLERVETDARVLDASGLLILPGGVDPHVHLTSSEEFAFADDFESGTRGALADGNHHRGSHGVSAPRGGPACDTGSGERSHRGADAGRRVRPHDHLRAGGRDRGATGARRRRPALDQGLHAVRAVRRGNARLPATPARRARRRDRRRDPLRGRRRARVRGAGADGRRQDLARTLPGEPPHHHRGRRDGTCPGDGGDHGGGDLHRPPVGRPGPCGGRGGAVAASGVRRDASPLPPLHGGELQAARRGALRRNASDSGSGGPTGHVGGGSHAARSPRWPPTTRPGRASKSSTRSRPSPRFAPA